MTGLVLLNLGAGEEYLSHAPPPWIDVDVRPSTRPDVVADLRALPFRTGAADRVYAGHVLEHLPFADVRSALREVLRVLAPGGRILVVGPDVDRSLELHRLGRITDERLASNRRHGEPGDPCVHQWDCSGRMVRSLMAKAGFADVEEIAITSAPIDFPVFDRGALDQFAVHALKEAA